MTAVILTLAGLAAAYELIAIVACLRHLASKQRPAVDLPPVSILKPLRGSHAGLYEALRSHALQQYPEFEILCGIQDPADPARAEVHRLIAEFPNVSIRVIECARNTPNGKVAALIDLARAAQHEVLIVNDADISVPSHYLRDVIAPLSDPQTGVVTCLYRAESPAWPARFEALGVATEFAPSTLVAPLFGVSEFGLGSTLTFRRADLHAIGGFESIADYLADDYQLAARIHKLGRNNVISKVVVTTGLPGTTWRSAWLHQLRWARTVRLSRPLGYAGLVFTFATLWSVTAIATGHILAGAALLALRLVMAAIAGGAILHSRDALRLCWLIPARDVYGVAIWFAGMFGNTVEWGSEKLRITRDGRIAGRR